ncbi:hypothetical protein J4E86_006850 [Alternaria arbusti]|uniref:uncharacterized protein n=1 Tax=Alternaria arbusti TaxID=232088 RepID=UPI00221EF9FE|nr:uncharacterized protein J4E86_006850 [Alternaria arbusti]KAI4953309.1 hypothetical protein J4E86_006850 [Alternaria arbusti]
MSTSNNPTTTGNLQAHGLAHVRVPDDANIAVWNILCNSPFTVDIAAESSTPEANPGRPQFLKGITFNAEKEEEWNNTVLPYIRLLTFTVASTTDTYFIGDMLQVLPDIDKNILKVDMNGFHWFSGITDNRSSNPYLALASSLPELQEMTFTLHTSTVTDSMFGERQLQELERVDPERAKRRVTRSVADIVRKYGMKSIFDNKSLKHLRLVYIKSDMVAAYTVDGNPENVIAGIKNWLLQGFRNQGQEVMVELSRAS